MVIIITIMIIISIIIITIIMRMMMMVIIIIFIIILIMIIISSNRATRPCAEIHSPWLYPSSPLQILQPVELSHCHPSKSWVACASVAAGEPDCLPDRNTCRHQGQCITHLFVHVYMCTCVHVYMCTCVHVYMCTCVHVYMCTCVHVYMCTCL